MDLIVQVPENAEDLKYSHLILHTHVTSRTILCANIVSTVYVLGSTLFKGLGSRTILPRIVSNAGRATIAGLIIGPLMTEGRMLSKKEIEWQDRSWRLLHNQSQNELDYFTATTIGFSLFTNALWLKYSIPKNVLLAIGTGHLLGAFFFGLYRGFLGFNKKSHIKSIAEKK